MKQVLVVEATGAVENIVEVADNPDPKATPWTPPEGRILVDFAAAAAIGGTWDGVAFLPPPDPPADRAAALAAIDAAAEAARGKWITLGSGQGLAYEAKRREAAAWALDAVHDPAAYPWARDRAARLAGIEPAAASVAQVGAVIDEWAAKTAAWEEAGIEIERIREAAKEAASQAATRSEIDAILAGLAWPEPAPPA